MAREFVKRTIGGINEKIITFEMPEEIDPRLQSKSTLNHHCNKNINQINITKNLLIIYRQLELTLRSHEELEVALKRNTYNLSEGIYLNMPPELNKPK